MNKISLIPKSTLEEAYKDQEQISDWSTNSKNAYRRNVKKVSGHMRSVGLEPTIENVTYQYCMQWKKDHAGKNPNTLNQQKSTMTSIFRHLNNANIIEGNPFLNVNISDYTADQYLSKDLTLTELYQVYKAAHDLQAEGVNVLLPMLIEIYTGLRSTNLKQLKVRTLDLEIGGLRIEFGKTGTDENNQEETTPNSKHRESFIPLPPKVLSVFSDYTKVADPEDSLLYGLRGKPFANKQMNYIVKRICEHLGWLKYSVEDDENSESTTNKKKKKEIKTDQYFTPHGLRYTIATIFHEMGVEDNAIRLLLLHSKKTELGALERYLRRDTREVKQLRMVQLLLETVLETALEMDEKFGVQMDLEAIYEQLPVAFENQMKNVYAVHLFKEQIIRFTMSKMEQALTQSAAVPNNVTSMFPMREGHSSMEPHPYMANPYQNGYQAGMGMQMAVNAQQPHPVPNGFYPSTMDKNYLFIRK
ncbi:tyrosine-type recombinase/integrase [Virgibacillus halophilus]|uniref:tyrosine-type recombinase/integrase n=1 Tax=Tigheibacillus halophilus TaxID=361280 RepID=UPI003643830E